MKEKTLNSMFLIFLIFVFILGFYLYVFDFSVLKEGITSRKNENDTECPDMLIHNGDSILLYNSKQPEVKGVNPIQFKNLDEYISYLDDQKKKGIRCPILYLQLENDAQGKNVYRVRSSPFDQEGGIPAVPVDIDKQNPVEYIDSNRDNPPYNSGNYAGFDPIGLHVGEYTVLDQIHDSTENAPISDNPQDPNWGGILYTESAVQSGKYADRVVTRPNYITPKGNQFFPGLYPSPN